jgi:hypothetical protein
LKCCKYLVSIIFRSDEEKPSTQNRAKPEATVPDNLAIRSATPRQLGFTNPNTLWPTHGVATEFYEILPSNVALSNQLSSSATSTTTTLRINSDFSISRLTTESRQLVPSGSKVRHNNSRIPSRRDPVVGLVRPTATRPTVPGHAQGEHQYTRTIQWTPAEAEARPEGTSHGNSRRSLPSTSSSSRATATGTNWKSRQPTQCGFCNRIFSNKFNLKQVITKYYFFSLWFYTMVSL